MGMFDRVWVPCPKCGHKNEGQSKGGESLLRDYDLDSDDVPADVLGYMVGDRFTCEKCQTYFELVVKAIGRTRILRD